ncbi:MAG: extracellular solute-binding protein [Verrucomicrobiota bacterium]
MISKKNLGIWGVLLVFGGLVVFFWKTPQNKEKATESPHLLRPSVSGLIPTLRLKGYGSKGEESFWREKIHEFELEKKCAVLVEWTQDEERYYSDLRSGKSTWDVVMMSDSELETFHAANLLTPLLVPAEMESKMVPSILSLYRRGDYYEGIPFGFSTYALYYNRQIFDRKGVAYPDDHWTWESLLGMARGLYSDAESGRPCYGIEVAWGWRLLNLFAGQSGEVLLNNQLLMKVEPTRSTVLGAQWLIDLSQNYSIDVPYSEGWSHFEKGEAAMSVAGPDLMNRLKVHHEFIWGVTKIPTGKIRSNTLSSQAWSVWGGASQRELAYALVLRLAPQATTIDSLPVYQPDTSAISLPPESIFYDSIANANPIPQHPLFFYWKERVKVHFNEVIDGTGTSASSWLDTINNEIQAHPQYPKTP